MMKGYILAGYGYTAEKVYTNRERAEKACENKNYGYRMGGHNLKVYVEEIEIETEEDEEE